MRKIITFLFALFVFWLSWGWKILDYIGRGKVFVNLGETFNNLTDFVSKHQEFGYQLAPWVIMLVAIFSMVLLQWPGLLTFWRRNKSTQVTPTITAEEKRGITIFGNQIIMAENRGRAIARFNRDDGTLLPNSANVASVLKNADGGYSIHLLKPMNPEITHCAAMTNTPTFEKFEMNTTGSALTVTWPPKVIAGNELPEIIALKIEE